MLVSLLILIAIDARGKAADTRPEIADMPTARLGVGLS
jgi:hypothetical protein